MSWISIGAGLRDAKTVGTQKKVTPERQVPSAIVHFFYKNECALEGQQVVKNVPDNM